MKKLSKPLSELKSDYDVIVVGSGYGGSIAASRMSRAGLEVCLLEKGKEFLPGEFPNTLLQSSREMNFIRGKSENLDRNGLYEFTMGNGINVFKGCGLGGTSLVNANVSIKPDPRVMVQDEWPTAIRENVESFHEGMDRAWEMLKPTPYPENKNGYPVLKKTEAMRKSAAFMSEPFRLLDINVNFEDKQNHVGIKQPKCTNCGDCVTGCNVGAKNTTAMNYLPDAFNHGAAIFTEINVRYVKKAGNRWQVFFHPVAIGREHFNAPLMFVTADRVVLSGGSLGSTEILFRSAQQGLSLSGQLGKRFTGNGDVLGFGYNNDIPIKGIGLGKKGTDAVADVGPCITSVIDMRGREDMESGMTLEEGTVPGPIRTIMPKMLITFSRLMGKDTDRGFVDFWKEKWRELKSLILGPFFGAVKHTQIYLVMTHDDGNGEMTLDDGKLAINWKGVGKQEIFRKVNGEIYSATKANGGTKIPNPTWNKRMNYDLVTVHPLGGCNMGDEASKGVVDHKGQVFSGKEGVALHQGLYVMDGAIIPRPVGTNPLLTISGLAERSCKLILEELGKPFSYAFNPPAEPDRNTAPTGTGVQFTETMRGFFGMGELEDYERGFEQGKKHKSAFEFTLTIQTEDMDHFTNDPSHPGSLFGTMLAPALSASPMTALGGGFNLFIENPEAPDRKKMKYTAILKSEEGDTFYFEGFKDIFNDRVVDVWKDTTTLFIDVYKGTNRTGALVGKGKLVIRIADFIQQLRTVKAIHASSKQEGIRAVATFGKFFAGNVFETYARL
ncbi:MAG: GMC family oxidoreductase [Lunatimonas sp.]|uniref:GMC family oxidoreductase N-terminal domain-containing protein n=1 Tax=Lunatimonas sp. TaxID=2060141 RepID=UPI00263B683D|nr:GMC family oxidoreductase [Lunatimonas sp.]MCC5938181.1 GMC family oxidoreductase [Lunatimonas sp.]